MDVVQRIPMGDFRGRFLRSAAIASVAIVDYCFALLPISHSCMVVTLPIATEISMQWCYCDIMVRWPHDGWIGTQWQDCHTVVRLT